MPSSTKTMLPTPAAATLRLWRTCTNAARVAAMAILTQNSNCHGSGRILELCSIAACLLQDPEIQQTPIAATVCLLQLCMPPEYEHEVLKLLVAARTNAQHGACQLSCHADRHLALPFLMQVNLRSETYAQGSRIPTMEFGTPEQDALRRDFTINS
eukprot:scaffold10127_cov19-Tisochrysis_lutea.AAC.1